MIRPIESDYMTHTAYGRALEDYCDVLAQQIRSCGGDCSAGLGKLEVRVMDANRAWAEYQNRKAILTVFEEEEK